jgi:membrane protease YdiL (CAAX protease family)
MKIAVVVTLVIAGAMAFSFRDEVAGTTLFWIGLAVPHALLAAFGIYRFYQDGELLTVLRPRAGDVSIGALIAAVMLGAGWLVRNGLFGPATERAGWLLRLALQLGGAKPSPQMVLAIALIASLEELVWRGLVLHSLTESVGSRRAWPLAALFYALAHIPTVFLLAIPVAGPNPVLLFAAAGCGLVWSFAASLMGRLPAVMISHAVFSYFAFVLLLPHFG